MPEINYLNLITTDPEFNLAAEQYVFDELPRDRNYFMLWQNDNAVIIGKYQNTSAEINETAVKENNIKVVRRLSGGGAVYHDLGNLNFTFIADAPDMENINLSLFCRPVIRALKAMGIEAEINGRNDMVIDGRKFSGNSQYARQGRIMHHGTIMFDSNLDMVNSALKVDKSKIQSKGIKSVRSRVTNIREYLSEDIPIETFRELLLSEILRGSVAEEYVLSTRDIERIEQIRKERYSTWEWNFGRSPQASYVRSARVEGCGKIEAYVTEDRGIITGMDFRGDFFSKENPEELAELFIGEKADGSSFEKLLENIDVSKYFANITNSRFIRLLTENG